MSDARKAILARRAKFLAAALAATMPACEREKEGIQPDHATRPTTIADAGAPATNPPPEDAALAMPCLEVAPTAADAGTKPHPCLKMPMPRDAGTSPTPKVCLKMAVDPDDPP